MVEAEWIAQLLAWGPGQIVAAVSPNHSLPTAMTVVAPSATPYRRLCARAAAAAPHDSNGGAGKERGKQR